MYKKILALVMALAVMFAFTGCMSSNNEVTVKANGTADVYVDFSIDKTKMSNIIYDVMLEGAKADTSETRTDVELQKEAADATKEIMDSFEAELLDGGMFKLEKSGGSEYYTMKEDAKGVTIKEARDVFKEYDSKAWLSAKGFDLDLSDMMEGIVTDEFEDAASDVDFDMEFKVTLPYEIVKTNGELSADKKTVSWSCTNIKNSGKLYAYAADKVKPVVTGVKNGKTYKKKVTVKVSDKDSGVKSAVIKNTRTGKTYARFTGSKKVTKKGKYSVTVTDNMGNKRTVKFTVK